MKNHARKITVSLGLCCALMSSTALAQLNVPIVRTLPIIGDPPIGALGKLPVLSDLNQSIGFVDLLGAKALPDIEPLLALEQLVSIGSLLALGGLPGLDSLPGLDALPVEFLTGTLPL